VEWKKIFEILKKIGVKYKDIRIIYSLYKNRSAVVKNDGIQKEARIRK
jgi:predicted DNA-binding transcriptional regulator